MTIDLTLYFCLLENFTSSKPTGYSGVKFSAGVELFCQIYFSKVSSSNFVKKYVKKIRVLPHAVLLFQPN